MNSHLSMDLLMPPRSARPPKNTRSDAVYLGLRRAIIEQALMPGDKLTEDAIGEGFGVSRTIVRTALGRLHVEGLVDIQPNKGATIAQPSLAEARDIFEARMGLERQVLARLAQRVTKRDIAQLTEHVAKEARADGADQAAAIRLAGEFHLLLATLAGNRVLARYVDELVSRCSLILALYGRPHSSECAVSEHKEIIEALAARDAARAMASMDHHLRAVSDRSLLVREEERTRDIRTILDRYAQG